MPKRTILILFLAAQVIACSSMVIAPTDGSDRSDDVQTDVQTESNLRVQSDSSTILTFSQGIWNSTMFNFKQREVEVQQADPPKVVNKVFWAIFAMWFGCCGIDRCFMGQICLGVLKGCTFGGFMFWYWLDYWACFISCIIKAKDIQWVGYDVVFEKDTIDGAFIIAIVFVIPGQILHLAQAFMAFKQRQLQEEAQTQLTDAMFTTSDNEDDKGLDIPTRHQSLAYIPTELTKQLRKAGFVQEKPTIPELIAVFHRIDKNGDGQLDHDEIKEAMGAMGISDKTVDEMIKAVDTDGDGKISQKEFLVSMTQKDNK